jgi:signal transduction histidine kinase/CheY-like chemotaxis protein/HPt (histidine-containing phosphotransfer) domain-containing protein
MIVVDVEGFMSIKDQHPSKLHHDQILSKMSAMYFNSMHSDLKTFVQEIVSELGNFLHVPIYVYEEMVKNESSIYSSIKETIKTSKENELINLWNQLKNEPVDTFVSNHLWLLSVNNKNIGFIHIDQANDTKLTHDDHLLIKAVSTIISYRFKEMVLSNQIQTLTEKNKQLEKTKQQFLANISHEIKTPLSGVYNALYLMGATDLSSEQNEYHELGTTSIDQLSNILDDLLDIKKMTSNKVEVYHDTFNLEEEMIRVVRMHKSFADEKKIDLKFTFDHRINFECIGDYRKIRQIVSNLIHNGIKFTSKGYVSLDVSLIEQNSDISIKFSIEDSGIGISSNQYNQLFELFYQVDDHDSKVYQGTGLGLPIADQLAKILLGKIEVAENSSQGTTFYVIIPMDKGRYFDYSGVHHTKAFIKNDTGIASSVFETIGSMGIKILDLEKAKKQKVDYIIYDSIDISEKTIEHDKNVMGNSKVITILMADKKHSSNVFDLVFEQPISVSTIYQRLLSKKEQLTQEEQYHRLLNAYALIVDDNRLNRVALSNILTKLGLKSKQAESGKTAIEILKKEMFDCVLMDIQMPEMDGIEATRRIRSLGKKYQKLPIIAVTANAFLKDYDVMKSSQITDVIFKPINVENLERVLRKYITSTKADFVPDDLFMFDEFDFINRFEGSNDIGNEVIQTFLSEYPKDMNKIQTAIISKDFKKIEHETHYFKGSCAYLSAKRLTWILSYIIDHARLNQLDEIIEAFPILEKEVERLIDLIKEYRL